MDPRTEAMVARAFAGEVCPCGAPAERRVYKRFWCADCLPPWGRPFRAAPMTVTRARVPSFRDGTHLRGD